MTARNTGPEREALIFNIQKYNTYDGPGVRTLIFFKGCPLRCRWCANPEGLERKVQIMFKAQACIHCGACTKVCPVGIHHMNAAGEHEVNREIDCIACGKCVAACPRQALSIVGERKTITELLEVVEEDRMFYEMSGGGVTLGGGECTAQPEAAISILAACKQAGINTAIETSGYTSESNILKIAEVCDLFLFDLKHMDPVKHMEWTGVNNEKILHNLTLLLEKGYNVKIRMPVLKGINDSDDEFYQVAEFLAPYKSYKNFQGVDILPYHKMGVGKYPQVGKVYPIEGDPSLSEADLDRLEKILSHYDFKVDLIRH